MRHVTNPVRAGCVSGAMRSTSLAVSCVLSACSLAPVISSSSIDYNNTVETATTSILVTNVLRAHDGAPLFFSDLSQIHGSLALDVSAQDTFPFGPRLGSTTRTTSQVGPIAVNSTPSFDIATLNTKQFYEGILNPVAPNVLGYLLQRGLAPGVILQLLISRIDVYDHSGKVLKESFEWSGKPGDHLSAMLQRWASGPRPAVKSAHEKSNFGPPLAGNLQSVIAANSSGLEVQSTPNGLQLVKATSSPVLCVSDGGKRILVSIVENSVVKGPSEPKFPSDMSACGAGDSPALRYAVTLRSVESIFYYLGTTVDMDNPPVPFHLWRGTSPDDWMHVNYRGEDYAVHHVSEHDGTTLILAILSDLLNINRDAAEIPTTKAVTVQ
jgi:hypothetical protein